MTLKIDEFAPSSHRNEVWFENNGARLFALDVGAGRPIVFVHGGLADHRSALARFATLTHSQRLIAPDLRGSGRSVWSGELSWDQWADDIAALLDVLELERAVIGGISMGSGVALRFALRHPRRVSGLLLMSPLYPGADRLLAEASVTAMRRMAEAGERALSEGMDAFLSLFDGLPPQIRARAIEMMLSFDAASVAATTRFLATNEQPFESVSELSSIAVPVMLVPGSDPEHPSGVAALYAENLRVRTILDPAQPDLSEDICRFLEDG